jgi:glycosyltransferase involved in cell wall biosynthesis
VVCNALANAEQVRQFVGATSPPIDAIYNPLDAVGIQRRFPQRDRSQWLDSAPLVTAHGRLGHQKGWDVLLRAFERVLAEVPEARLRIVGEGPERGELERLAAELGLQGHCELPGFSSDPIAAIEEGDVYVLPSRWEGLPNSLLEAIGAGLPAVAADCPTGPLEILGRDGEFGLLVGVEAVDELANALLRLLGDAALRVRLAAGARRRALDFTLEKNVMAYRPILSQLVGTTVEDPPGVEKQCAE